MNEMNDRGFVTFLIGIFFIATVASILLMASLSHGSHNGINERLATVEELVREHK